MNEPAVNQEASGIYEFSLIPSEQISLVWNQVEEYLKKSAKRSDGRTRVEDIFYDLINNQTQLWIIFDTGNLNFWKKYARLGRAWYRHNDQICKS
jgi:hypothetical protein